MGELCTVASIMREPLALTMRFVSWYLRLGAARIVIFFDDPEDAAIPALAREPRVTCIPCDAAFWTGIGIAPDQRFTARQNAALTRAYREAATPWFLNVDGDELVHLGGRSLDAFIAGLPQTPTVRFTSAEAVRTDDGASWFRIPIDRRTVRRIYGEDAPFFAPRGGLVGHADGKSMTRTGIAVDHLRQHWAVQDGAPVAGLSVGLAEEALLLHFFDSGFENWRRKFDWRTGSWGFARRVSDLIRDGDARALYEKLHHLGADRLAALAAAGGCIRLDLGDEAWQAPPPPL